MKTKNYKSWDYENATGSYESKRIKSVLYVILLVLAILSGIVQKGFPQGANISKASIKATPIELNYKAMPVRLGEEVNSAFNELKPLISPDGKTLYFSRQYHPQNTKGASDPEDIWYSQLNEVTNTWGIAKRFSAPINNSGPNFLTALCFTADTLFLGNTYTKNGKMKAGLSYSIWHGDSWSQPKTVYIPHSLNKSPQVSYFVCVRKKIIMMSMERIGYDGRVDSYGDRDLYISFLKGDDLQAEEPINLGPVINTHGTESAPYLAPDGKTLFFASSGHDGFGGLDLYVSTRLDNTWLNWSEPKNLGPYINSGLDDEFFSFTSDGHYGYFSREFDSEDSDIYWVKLDLLFGLDKAQELANIKYEPAYIDEAKQNIANLESLMASY